MSSPDREIRHEEFLAKKFFMEALFHIQLILYLILSNFPDPTGLRTVVFLDLHLTVGIELGTVGMEF